MNRDYDGRQYVGIDLHRRRSVIVRMTPDGEQLGWVRINNDPVALGLELAKAGPAPGGGARQRPVYDALSADSPQRSPAAPGFGPVTSICRG